MKKITSLILVACISLTFAACSQGETAELTLPDYATVTAGELEGYEEWIQSTRGHFYTAQTYNSPERDSFAGYFCAIPPTSGEVIEMYGPEDEGLILKGTYAYNFVDGDLSSFKLSFEETDCEPARPDPDGERGGGSLPDYPLGGQHRRGQAGCSDGKAGTQRHLHPTGRHPHLRRRRL